MIDYRLETFLTLYNELNYTKTAEKLHITQPNVSQHIKFLEDYYKDKLFIYENRKLKPSPSGVKLYNYASRLKSDSLKIKKSISKNNHKETINFGTTLTVGEYMMPNILSQINYQNINLSMKVENTFNLLKKLEEGKLNFIIVEGHFNKTKYESHIFSLEKFIGIASHKYENKNLRLEDLINEKIILREKGSGTRETFQQILFDNNLNLSGFRDIIEIGNLTCIKELVSKNIGISFLYEIAASDYIMDGKLKVLDIQNFNITRPINFVFLKDSHFKYSYLDILKNFKKIHSNSEY